MSVVTETFTGSNGATAPSPWVLVTLSGSQNIQSNKWRINDGDAYQGTAMTYGATSYTDVDITTEITLSADGAEQYPGVGARMAGGTNGWTTYAEVNNGYIAYLETNNDRVHIGVASGGGLIYDFDAPVTLTNGLTVKLRFQLIGSTIRCKAWDASGGEPGAWMVSTTDATYASGLIGFRDQAPSNTTTSIWDNYVIDNAPAGGAGGVLGNADADLIFTADTTGIRTMPGTAASPFIFVADTIGTSPTRGGGAALVAARAGRGR